MKISTKTGLVSGLGLIMALLVTCNLPWLGLESGTKIELPQVRAISSGLSVSTWRVTANGPQGETVVKESLPGSNQLIFEDLSPGEWTFNAEGISSTESQRRLLFRGTGTQNLGSNPLVTIEITASEVPPITIRGSIDHGNSELLPDQLWRMWLGTDPAYQYSYPYFEGDSPMFGFYPSEDGFNGELNFDGNWELSLQPYADNQEFYVYAWYEPIDSDIVVRSSEALDIKDYDRQDIILTLGQDFVTTVEHRFVDSSILGRNFVHWIFALPNTSISLPSGDTIFPISGFNFVDWELGETEYYEGDTPWTVGQEALTFSARWAPTITQVSFGEGLFRDDQTRVPSDGSYTVGTERARITQVAALSQGGWLVSGHDGSGPDIFFTQFNELGQRNTSFGSTSNGVVYQPRVINGGVYFGDSLGFVESSTNPGAFWGVGYYQNGMGNISVRRYLANGNVDTSFRPSNDNLLVHNNGGSRVPVGQPVVDSVGNFYTITYEYGMYGILKVDPSGTATEIENLLSPSSQYHHTLAIQGNDKLLAIATGGTIQRISTDLSHDTSFDGDGIVTIAGNPDLKAVVVDSSGRIIVAGSAGPDGYVYRYLSSGAIDTSFGTNGVVTLDYPLPMDMAILPTGSIVVVGDTEANETSTTRGFVQRLGPNGEYLSFGTLVLEAGGSSGTALRSVAIDDMGKMLLGGLIKNDATTGGLNTKAGLWMWE